MRIQRHLIVAGSGPAFFPLLARAQTLPETATIFAGFAAGGQIERSPLKAAGCWAPLIKTIGFTADR